MESVSPTFYDQSKNKGTSIKWRHILSGRGICDDNTMPLVIKQVEMGGRDRNGPKLRDVIYGRPQIL